MYDQHLCKIPLIDIESGLWSLQIIIMLLTEGALLIFSVIRGFKISGTGGY